MSFAEFREALASGGSLPAGLPAPAQALWDDARGNWPRAHALVQDADTAEAAWVHAYLHRKEGDLGNAGYWYRRAGRPAPSAHVTLAEEWEAISRALLG